MNKKVALSALMSVLLSTALSLCVVGLLEVQIAHASPYTNIDVDTAYNMITNGSYPDLIVLDVRTKGEYDSGHIYGAVWIPHTELDARIGELAGHENHEIIAYCKLGGRSAIASDILDSHNFTKVYNMQGGITAWRSAGYPVWIATVHNINTNINYDTIQAAIDAPQTLDGHTILADAEIYYEHVVITKSISLIGENTSITIIDGNGITNVVNVTTQHVRISGFTVQNSGSEWGAWPDSAIFIRNGRNCSFTGNLITNNYFGITMVESSYDILVNNKISDNDGVGIALYRSSNNTMSDNKISNNLYGIYLDSSSKNAICNNDIKDSYYDGVSLAASSSNNLISNNKISSNHGGVGLSYSSGNMVSNNNLSNNSNVGLWLLTSENNTVSMNTVTNSWFGISLSSSNSNAFYHNNLINNTQHVYSENSTNTWDNGYPSGGNYWSEHVCTGNPSDGSQPYVMDENNIDHYPFQDPNAWVIPGDINVDEIVDIHDVLIVALAFGTKPGDPDWNPIADINNDGTIDIFDLVIIGVNFGKRLPL